MQRRLRPLALGLLVVVLSVLAIRMARSAPPEGEKEEGKKAPLESFKPTERIAPEQAVDFPVDI